MSDTIRVRIVMERRMVREGLVYVLQSDPRIRVVGALAVPDEEPELSAMEPADVILIDMDDASTAEAWFAEELAVLTAEARVVAVASAFDDDVMERLGSIGALSVSLKTSPSAELLTMVHAAAAGESLPLPAQNGSAPEEGLESDRNEDNERFLLGHLTPREREILQSIAHGGSTAEVARNLSISTLTVQSHVKNILAKLSVHSKIQAVGLALRHGLVAVPGIDVSDSDASDERPFLREAGEDSRG